MWDRKSLNIAELSYYDLQPRIGPQLIAKPSDAVVPLPIKRVLSLQLTLIAGAS